MKLRIMNETGHTDLILNQEEMIEQINDHPTHWVIVDGECVLRENIVNVEWDEVNNVNLVPAIVGGTE